MAKDKSKVEVRQGKAAPVAAPSASAAPLTSLRDEIDRLFEDFGAGIRRWPFPRRMLEALPAAGQWPVVPAMEVVDGGGAYRITAELPGMKPGDIEIRMTDGAISIRGEKTEEKKEEKESYLLRERRYGSFHRSLALPSGIDARAVTARFADGVLTVTLPKTAEAKEKERKIEVKAA